MVKGKLISMYDDPGGVLFARTVLPIQFPSQILFSAIFRHSRAGVDPRSVTIAYDEESGNTKSSHLHAYTEMAMEWASATHSSCDRRSIPRNHNRLFPAHVYEQRVCLLSLDFPARSLFAPLNILTFAQKPLSPVNKGFCAGHGLICTSFEMFDCEAIATRIHMKEPRIGMEDSLSPDDAADEGK